MQAQGYSSGRRPPAIPRAASRCVNLTPHQVLLMRQPIDQPHHFVLICLGIKPQPSSGPGCSFLSGSWQTRSSSCCRVADVESCADSVVEEGEAAARHGRHYFHTVATGTVDGEQ
uniref:Uncharacterized protein n=1 Tax=Triticum urartu TaxID=4572 RepID=A0A8R7JW73_TRIUA